MFKLVSLYGAGFWPRRSISTVVFPLEAGARVPTGSGATDG
jgi:hypothetical protein